MKENEIKMSFWHQVALMVFCGFHILGATTIVIIVLALCGVPMRWWIGSLCAIPGALICRVLTEYLWRKNQEEKRKAEQKQEPITDSVLEQEAEPPEAKVDCRFSEDGACTYGDSAGMACDKLKEVQVQSVEDPDTVYLQTGDIRRIIYEGKEVGWYRWE